MGAILSAVLGSALTWLLRTIVIKVVMFAVIYVVTSLFLTELIKYLPDFSGGLSKSFADFTPNMWFIFDTMSFTTGFPLLLSAYLARFAIRRIPFVG